MVGRKKVHWDEAELSKYHRRCRTSLDYQALPSPYPFTDDVINVNDDDLTDTDEILTDTEDTLIGEDGALTDTDDTLECIDDTVTSTDDILIDKDDTLTESKDDLTDTDDTLIDEDGALTDTNDANEVLPKTGNDSLDMGFVLSIDSGGIRGYSSLMILQALMEEIEAIERADNPTATSSISPSVPRSLHSDLCAVPKPISTPISERRLPHYFDYIGGTGSGNVIATMLTDEKMTVAQVTETYRDMCAPGPPRRLINRRVVFSKRDQASIWFQGHTRTPLKLAWPSLYKHKGATLARKADINNPTRTILEAAHFRLLDDSVAKHGLSLLSIGAAITAPVDSSADPLRYHLSRQTRRVHEELLFRISRSENRNGRLFNLERYSRLDVRDSLGDVGVDGWGSEDSDERTRWRIEGATGAYLQREEVRDEIHGIAVCLVNKRRYREGRLGWERLALGIGDRYPGVDLGYCDS